MNLALGSAALLLFTLGAAHSYLGERYILMPLLRRADDLPHVTRRILRIAWHLTTLAWWGFALLVDVARTGSGDGTPAQIGSVVALVSVANATAILVGSRGRHFGWPIFLGIAALVWFGTHGSA